MGGKLVTSGQVALVSDGENTWSLDLVRPPSKLPVPIQAALKVGVYATPTDAVAKGDGLAITQGAVTESMRELFVSGGVGAGIVLIKQRNDGWTASMAKTLLPYVLTKEAVEAGVMPPAGQSWLPASIERVIPERFAYWKDEQTARVRRDALVASGFFEDNIVKVVDGELRLCTMRLFLYEPDGESPPLSKCVQAVLPDGEVLSPDWDGDWKDELSKVDSKTAVVLSLPDASLVPDVCKTVLSSEHVNPTLIEVDDSPEAREEMSVVGALFKFADHPDSLLVSTFDLADETGIVWVSPELPTRKAVWSASYINDLPDTAFLYIEPGGEKDEEGKTKPRSLRHFPVRDVEGNVDGAHVRNALSRIPQSDVPQSAKDAASKEAERLLGQLNKSDPEVTTKRLIVVRKEDGQPTEERFVLGVVLEPETTDAQNDIYSEEEIRNACHEYMEKFRGNTRMHDPEEHIEEKVVLLENFIAPADFSIGEDTVKKGTWLQAYRVVDDALWEEVKTGGLGGFSIGGSAVRAPEN